MLEVERKFIVPDTDLADLKKRVVKSESIEQAYISSAKEFTIRVRITHCIACGNSKHIGKPIARLCTKSPDTDISMIEHESIINVDHANVIIEKYKDKSLTKIRHTTEDGFEIDEFLGKLLGLVVVEKEFNSIEEAEEFDLPENWLDVSNDHDYKNSVLIGMLYEEEKLTSKMKNLISGSIKLGITPMSLPPEYVEKRMKEILGEDYIIKSKRQENFRTLEDSIGLHFTEKWAKDNILNGEEKIEDEYTEWNRWDEIIEMDGFTVVGDRWNAVTGQRHHIVLEEVESGVTEWKGAILWNEKDIPDHE